MKHSKQLVDTQHLTTPTAIYIRTIVNDQSILSINSKPIDRNTQNLR